MIVTVILTSRTDTPMPRIFPNEITNEDTRRLIASLSTLKPYSSDRWETASFHFDAPDITINVKLTDGIFDSNARKKLELVITLLPALHGTVIETVGTNGPLDGSDDHWLSWLDIDANEVDVCYNCISYNSSWGRPFHYDETGRWKALAAVG